MIETITHAWKQLGSHLGQLITYYTKPLTSGLVISVLSDATRSRADLIAENALLRQQLIILRRQVKRCVGYLFDPRLFQGAIKPPR